MYDLILSIHVPVALSCMPAFWIPAFARKGGRLHVLVGRYFVAAMGFVALSGMAMGAIRLFDPTDRIAGAITAGSLGRVRGGGVFFLYLGIITLAPLLHGWRVVRTRQDPERMRSVPGLALMFLAITASLGVVLAALYMPGAPRTLLLALSPIGLVFGLVGLDYIRRPTRFRMSWWYAHTGAMIGAGIAAHTAFSVFVVSRWIAPGLAGWLAVLPWILPTVIGVPAIFIAIRRAMIRFGDRPTPTA